MIKRYNKSLAIFLVAIFALGIAVPVYANTQLNSKTSPIVFLTDFGLKDGAVSAMKGVAFLE